MDRLCATSLIETALPLEQAAATLAGEQSSGTFVAVPGETAGFKARFAEAIFSLRMNISGSILATCWRRKPVHD